MNNDKRYCSDCGYDISHYSSYETMCGACLTGYWAVGCEECHAEPEQACALDCVNAQIGFGQ